MLVRMAGDRVLQIVGTHLQGHIRGEIEEPRQFPQRLVRPGRAIKPEYLRRAKGEPKDAEKPVMGQNSCGAVTAVYSM